jgi:D-arginine dehydrogenase
VGQIFSAVPNQHNFLMQTQTPTQHADFLIIGSGIAAASVGYWLAEHGRVVLLERESQPGYHSTGRSAAMFMESYGTPQVRALTRASRAFFEQPPAGFTEHPILTPRGALIVASPGQEDLLEQEWQALQAASPQAQRLDAAQTCAMLPVLRPEQVLGAVYEGDAADMDVHALHQGFLRGARQHGGQLVCDAEVQGLHHDGTNWQVQAGGQHYSARVVINAAGAWCDEIAAMAGAAPIGLVPKRRSAFVFAPAPGLDCARWPMAIAVDETWYLKPDAGQLLGSCANADPVPPQDVQPEELDIATGIWRIEEMTTLQILRPSRSWAGLRSFVEDGDLVGGFDSQAPHFFWVAAQGGYGIQTSAAMGQACAALVRGLPLPDSLAEFGITPQMLSRTRE